jgi:hypothetical protein
VAGGAKIRQGPPAWGFSPAYSGFIVAARWVRFDPRPTSSSKLLAEFTPSAHAKEAG